jgi:hypothetical protein
MGDQAGGVQGELQRLAHADAGVTCQHPRGGGREAAAHGIGLVADTQAGGRIRFRQHGRQIGSQHGWQVDVEGIAGIEETRPRRALGAAGFNITSSHLAGGLEDLVELVAPILQARGPFRTAYAGTTLRSHLGLPRPEQRAA